MSMLRPSPPLALTLSAGITFAVYSAPAAAQQPEPAGEQPAAAADPFAVEDEDLFLLREPETPDEFFRATLQAQNLARPNLARLYLQRFLELNPDDAALLALRDQYGPAAFARLANQRELQPLSTQLADRVADVFRQRGASPERVEALLDALGGSPEESFPAREALVNAGDVVIPQILLRLQQEQDDFARQQLLDVLVAMGEPALPALHAALDAPTDALRVQVASVLGRIGSRESIANLYFPAYGPDQPVAVHSAARRALAEIARLSRVATDRTSPADVATRLQEEAIAALEAAEAQPDEADPTTGDRVWSWVEQHGTVRSAVLERREAALYRGTRFARQAFLMAPNRAQAQALYLAFLLESEATQARAAEPPSGPGTAFNRALAAGPETAIAVLQEALRHDVPRGAVGALAVIARTASPSILYSETNVVGDALNHADPRVQLAAAVTVLRLNPDRPFRQAGRVVAILSRALSSEAVPTAVIIDPNPQRGSTLAGFTREMGYDALLTATGQQGFTAATERVEPAFVLVNLNVARWPLSQTLANLRADVRTQSVPVIVYGPAEGEWRARPVETPRYALFRGPGSTDPRSAVARTLAEVPRTAYVVETATSAAFAAQVRPALVAFMADPLSPADLAEGRAVAAFWLAQVADTRRTDLFPLVSAEAALVGALADPALAANAMIALSAIPTATAQQAISDVVLAPTADGNIQRTAAGVLTDHVRRYGLLLGDTTVAKLNRQWATTTDPELRTALATFGGSLQPGTAVAREQLEAVPPPRLPTPSP